MIPKVRLGMWLNIVACSILLASATPLPHGVAVHDNPTTISDAMTQDTTVNLPNIPDRDINSNLIPISNLHTTSASSKLETPFHPTDTYVESLLPRGKDDVPSASKTKPVSGNVRKQRSRRRQRRDDELQKSGELARIMSLSREERIMELQRMKQGQPGNVNPVEGKGKEPEVHDSQPMAYMMNTHHESGPSSSGVWDDMHMTQHLGQFSSSAWDSTHQHPGQPSNHAEWDYTMGTTQNYGQSSSSSWAAPGHPNHTPHQDQQWEGWDSKE